MGYCASEKRGAEVWYCASDMEEQRCGTALVTWRSRGVVLCSTTLHIM